MSCFWHLFNDIEIHAKFYMSKLEIKQVNVIEQTGNKGLRPAGISWYAWEFMLQIYDCTYAGIQSFCY